MGSSESKSETDNKGLANGNIINNGNIDFQSSVNNELKHIEITLYISLVAKFVLILIVLLKWYTKRVRKNQNQEQKLNEIVLQMIKKGEK